MCRRSPLRIVHLIVMGWLTASVCVSAEPPPQSESPAFDDASLEFFEKEVRPILTARCTECHGAGRGDPKGGLSLTSRRAAIKGGDTGPAIVPGKTKDSLLVSAIEYGDLYQMPPKSKLPAKEIATLIKWVELGAPWSKEATSTAATVKPFDLAARKSEHWCWQPIANPSVPAVNDPSWPLSAVDRFILSRLESKGLKPAAAAEKHTLLRRVYFDLIGLPPSRQEVSDFLADSSPQAFEHVIDRLLNSVHFGERWGRHWLDLVRYAETRGHEFEPIIPNAWQYRDYVIRAINDDVPYDRFLTEHIAGDLIEPRWRRPSPDTAAANPIGTPSGINDAPLGTGFWFLGEEVHSPVDIRKDETDRMDNRLDVMSKTFLGLTVACARCHDHKFDAISQRDYYALTGFLISGSYRQVRVQTEQNDRRIATKLHDLRAEARRDVARILRESSQPTLEKLGRYLFAARQLVDGGITLVDVPLQPSLDEVVFADFEGDSWGGWKVEGTAFGERPARKNDNTYNAPLEGFRGDRFVNSHRNPPTGENTAEARDAHVGKLISPTFTIDRNVIGFQIGGGAHAGRTCINLDVDGKTVRSATGQNSGTLRTETWRVDDLRGKQARIEIVDAESGGWGHILVDQILFSNDTEPAGVAKQVDGLSRQKVDALAAEKQLDAEVLGRWCVELTAARADAKHLLHSYANPKTAPQSTRPTKPLPGLVVDFSNPTAGDLIQDGVSFGLRPTRGGDLQVSAIGGRLGLHVSTVGAWERDLFWRGQKLAPGTEDDHGTLGSWHRHGRMVRTPEFTLTGTRLWYLVRGNVRAYVSVNSHLIVAGPLHGSVVREFKQTDNQWRWVDHGLDLYKGHRLHVEFSPVEEGDCSIAMVTQSDEAPPLPDLAAPPIDISGVDSLAKQADLLQSHFAAAFEKLTQQQIEGASQSTSSDATLLNWVVEHRVLFAPPGTQQIVDERLKKLASDEAQLAEQVQWESQLAPAMLDGNGVDELLLIRGNAATPRDAVHRRFLDALGGATPPDGTASSGRIALAQQMLQSPLAARVAVNRIWHHLFGRGIVPSVDNLGVLGQAPTHPELLDHLATHFVKEGWSTKKLIKSLLLSRTYQMSSHPSDPAETLDPDNSLWHRMPIKRLEGEVIRDSLLAVSGRLDRTPFGPSVPIHLTPFMEGRGRPGVNGPLDGNGRRSIYIAVRRNFLSPMMLAFDTPSPFSTVGRRTTSNVPAQALILMNDPLVIEMARQWATQLLAESSLSTEQRIERLYLAAFARQPSDAEKSDAIAFLESQGQRFAVPDQQRKDSPQAWVDLCHVLFNVKEFVFID